MSTIVEALGGNPGETIVEALGGNPGDTIAEAIESREKPEPEPIVSTFKVTFNPNANDAFFTNVATEESMSHGDPLVIDVTEGSSVNFEKEGTSECLIDNGKWLLAKTTQYMFTGWAKTSSSKSATVDSPFTPEADTELFAVWTGEDE